MYTAYALVRCWFSPALGPPLPESERVNNWGIVAREFFPGLVPPSLLVGFALGSIVFGWATPTEGAACGAFGAFVLIIVPILIPALEKLEVNLVWFGIRVAVNLQTAWLSPPVALSAYFLKGVVPEWDLKDIYLGMMQLMLIQLLGLVLILIFLQIALWLPELIYGP